MAVINFGSINVDYTYRTPHLVMPGETLASTERLQGLGGKGMNQSIALHRAGVDVLHVGAMETGDQWTAAQITDAGVDLAGVAEIAVPTGHAIIEVSEQGENRIILYPGANHQLTSAQINSALSSSVQSKFVLTQNENNRVAEILQASSAAGKTVVFNPAPCDAATADLPLESVDYLVVNEVELMQLAGEDAIEAAIVNLRQRLTTTKLVVTLGADGVRYVDADQSLTLAAQKVDQVVDTTAAGDTFIGYFMAGLVRGVDISTALQWGISAAAVTVTKAGASASIPWHHDLTLTTV